MSWVSLWVTAIADGQGFAPCHPSSCAQVRWKTEQGLAQLVVVLLHPGHLRLVWFLKLNKCCPQILLLFSDVLPGVEKLRKPQLQSNFGGCACLWPGDSGDSWQAGWVAGGWAPSAGLCCNPMKGRVMSGTWGGAGSGVGAGCVELRVGGPKGDMGRTLWAAVTVGCR